MIRCHVSRLMVDGKVSLYLADSVNSIPPDSCPAEKAMCSGLRSARCHYVLPEQHGCRLSVYKVKPCNDFADQFAAVLCLICFFCLQAAAKQSCVSNVNAAETIRLHAEAARMDEAAVA